MQTLPYEIRRFDGSRAAIPCCLEKTKFQNWRFTAADAAGVRIVAVAEADTEPAKRVVGNHTAAVAAAAAVDPGPHNIGPAASVSWERPRPVDASKSWGLRILRAWAVSSSAQLCLRIDAE